jgi:hypothetical protein
MQVKSFGCSFIFGSDLPDDEADGICSKLTWPALIAKEANMGYSCYAAPGSGNMRILESILSQAETGQHDLFIIGWTWIDRFDYTDTQDSWKTILPVDTTKEADFYYRNLHSQYRDKLMTLICIRTAIDVLNQKQIPFIMTYMDRLIFETEWHTTPAVINLQKYILPFMSTFDGKTFLEWSKHKNFPISVRLHPLESAHKSGAKIMLDQIRRRI